MWVDGWRWSVAGANPQTSLVSETLFLTSLRSPRRVTAVGATLFIIPRDKHICASLPCRRGIRELPGPVPALAARPFSGRKNFAVDFIPI